MASVTQRIKAFVNGPQGRRLMENARLRARKPSTQQKLRRLAGRITGRPSGRR